MDHNTNELLTIDDLCNTLLIGRNAAYTLLNSGELHAFRIGRNWKIPKVALDEYILRQCNLDKK